MAQSQSQSQAYPIVTELPGFVKTKNASVITDLRYDEHGKRLATASTDQRLRIYELVHTVMDNTKSKQQPQEQEQKQTSSITWQLRADFKAHNASITRLAWAHPEFGVLLASAAHDRAVHVHQETADRYNQRQWRRVARITDARDAITDIDFAPRHLGLKMAAGSLDGRVRLYESNDLIHLDNWPLVDEFDAGGPVYSLSWNQNPFDAPTIAVASNNAVRIYSPVQEQQGQLSVVALSSMGRWTPIIELGGSTDIVQDVAFAPNMGRSYSLVATACKDMFVRIYKVYLSRPSDDAASNTAVSAQLTAKLGHHHSPVWRVAWNITGTVLASSGDDGSARLFKANSKGEWQPVAIASPSDHSFDTAPSHLDRNSHSELLAHS